MTDRPLHARTQAEALATGRKPRSIAEFYWLCSLSRLPREILDDPLLADASDD